MSRKQYTIHYIYKTTNIITGKFYVGMHSTFDINDDYLGSGKYLWRSIRKYGKDNHKKEILEFCKDRIELKKREEEIVTENFIKDKMCMNLMHGGQGGYNENAFGGIEGRKKGRINSNRKIMNRIMNDEVLYEKFCSSIKNAMLNLKGKRSGEKNNFYGKKHTQEYKEKMRIQNLGKGNSQFGTIWIFNEKLKLNKKIKKEDLKKFIKLGYKKGRKL